MNRKLRPHVDRSPLARAALYLPDRILDLMDVVTVGVHVGPGAFVDVHATRAVQASGGARSTGGVGLHEGRSLGTKGQAEAGLTVIALGAQTYAGGLVGTSGAASVVDSLAGMHQPSDRLYQEIRDYWAVGASATVGAVGFEADVHLLQIADFLTGWVGIDYLHDDFAHTRALRFDEPEPKLLAELSGVRQSRESQRAYREAKAPQLARD